MDQECCNYSNACDNRQRMNSPQYTKHALLHLLEMACKRWTHISMDCITDLPRSERATMMGVVADRFTKMAHLIPITK
jgi:hypothetical protein